MLTVTAKLGNLCSRVSRIEKIEFPVAASHIASTQMVNSSDLVSLERIQGPQSKN